MAIPPTNTELIGRIGADAKIVTLANGTKTARLRVCSHASYVSKHSGQHVDAQEWHHVVTFQPGLVAIFEKHARKDRLIFLDGELHISRCRKDGENTQHLATEITVHAIRKISFLN